MAHVVVTNPTCSGLGIEEDTAVIIGNVLDFEDIGTRKVIVVDAFGISEANIEEFTAKKPVTIRDLKLHILSGGDQYRIIQSNPPHI